MTQTVLYLYSILSKMLDDFTRQGESAVVKDQIDIWQSSTLCFVMSIKSPFYYLQLTLTYKLHKYNNREMTKYVWNLLSTAMLCSNI
jgi:hypothetical protein